MRKIERIAEYSITEWEGVAVRVTIQHPKLSHTITSQMVLDSRMIDDIHYINLPEDLELMQTGQKMFEYHQWKAKNARAHSLVTLIANNIANHILRTLQEELNR